MKHINFPSLIWTAGSARTKEPALSPRPAKTRRWRRWSAWSRCWDGTPGPRPGWSGSGSDRCARRLGTIAWRWSWSSKERSSGRARLNEGRCTYLARKEGLVIELVLHPAHQQLYVLRRRHLQRSLHVLPVRPQILKFLTGAHDGTCLFGAVFSERAVHDGYFVVKLDGVNC